MQCRKTRKAPPSCLGCDRFVEAWKPSDLILTSRQKVRDQAQKFLFQRHKERFQGSEVPLLYHPNDSRKQNTLVTIPGTNQKQQLVLNDIKGVTIKAAEAAIQIDDWRLGYALTVHSSQGLTIKDPKKSGS